MRGSTSESGGPEVKTSLFSFELPEELIAQEPAGDRDSARLLVLERNTGATTDSSVRELARWLDPGTVVVLNDTRVRKARLFGTSEGGARVEFLLLDRLEPTLWETLAGRARRLAPGKAFRFPGDVTGRVEAVNGEKRLVRFDSPVDDGWLEKQWSCPPAALHQAGRYSRG